MSIEPNITITTIEGDPVTKETFDKWFQEVTDSYDKDNDKSTVLEKDVKVCIGGWVKTYELSFWLYWSFGQALVLTHNVMSKEPIDPNNPKKGFSEIDWVHYNDIDEYVESLVCIFIEDKIKKLAT